MSDFPYEQYHDDYWAGQKEIDRLQDINANLLKACEAEEAFWKHYDACHECSRTTFCQDALWLMVKARGLRLRAIAEAKGEE